MADGPSRHFIECAYFTHTSRPFLLPMLEEGMLVRDFATYVRDTLCIPPTLNVVLCDAWKGKPLRGLHWLLPNTALQIRFLTVPDDKPLRVPLPTGSGLTVGDKREGEGRQTGDGLHIHIFMDAIVTAEGHGIGGIGILNTAPDSRKKGHDARFKTVVHDTVLNVRSAKACEEYFLRFAETYTAQHFGENATLHIYGAIRQPRREAARAFSVHWIDLAAPELTQLRKASVRAHLAGLTLRP